MALELVASVEERQLDQERDADDPPAQLLDQPERGGHRASRREQVVDGEHALAALDRVLVHRERVTAVLELVLDLDGLAGKLAELAHGHEARAELLRAGAAADQAPPLHTPPHLPPPVPLPLP